MNNWDRVDAARRTWFLVNMVLSVGLIGGCESRSNQRDPSAGIAVSAEESIGTSAATPPLSAVEARIREVNALVREVFPIRAGMSRTEVSETMAQHDEAKTLPSDGPRSDRVPENEVLFGFVLIDEDALVVSFVSFNSMTYWCRIECEDGRVRNVWLRPGTFELFFGEAFLVSGEDGAVPPSDFLLGSAEGRP